VLIINETNVGIAAALNNGVKRALLDGADYVLTLDQDTSVSRALVQKLLQAGPQLGPDSPFLIAAPRTVNGYEYKCVHGVSGNQCSVETIQSGMLFHSSAFHEIGYFREELFIDGVEADYLIRMHRAERHVLLLNGVDLEQPLGNPFMLRAFGRTIRSNNHPPFRRYYITRNRLVLVREHWRREPEWARVAINRLLRQSLRAAIVEPGRRQKIRAMAVGALHSITGRMGPLPPPRHPPIDRAIA